MHFCPLNSGVRPMGNSRRTLKRTVFFGFAIGLIGVGFCYGTPWLAQAECRSQTSAYIKQNHIKGQTFSRSWVAADPDSVEVRVSGPLMVETRFSVPDGRHSKIYLQTFVTLPWRISLESSKITHTM